MPLALRAHPEWPSHAVTRMEAEASRSADGKLVLRYLLTGTIRDLRLPPLAAPARRDDLWQHSCFEAFARASPQGPYHEFNFSPSSEWAAYEFSGYRRRMNSPVLMNAPPIETRCTEKTLELSTELDLASAPTLADKPVWHLGLSAVIEETSGRKSYWALAHPAGDPDFHHSDCFALELAAAGSP